MTMSIAMGEMCYTSATYFVTRSIAMGEMCCQSSSGNSYCPAIILRFMFLVMCLVGVSE